MQDLGCLRSAIPLGSLLDQTHQVRRHIQLELNDLLSHRRGPPWIHRGRDWASSNGPTTHQKHTVLVRCWPSAGPSASAYEKARLMKKAPARRGVRRFVSGVSTPGFIR